jgi:hypothetical protein
MLWSNSSTTATRARDMILVDSSIRVKKKLRVHAKTGSVEVSPRELARRYSAGQARGLLSNEPGMQKQLAVAIPGTG